MNTNVISATLNDRTSELVLIDADAPIIYTLEHKNVCRILCNAMGLEYLVNWWILIMIIFIRT